MSLRLARARSLDGLGGWFEVSRGRSSCQCPIYQPQPKSWTFRFVLAGMWQRGFNPTLPNLILGRRARRYFPTLLIVLLAVFNDGAMIALSKDRVVASRMPNSWHLGAIFGQGARAPSCGTSPATEADACLLNLADLIEQCNVTCACDLASNGHQPNRMRCLAVQGNRARCDWCAWLKP